MYYIQIGDNVYELNLFGVNLEDILNSLKKLHCKVLWACLIIKNSKQVLVYEIF